MSSHRRKEHFSVLLKNRLCDVTKGKKVSPRSLLHYPNLLHDASSCNNIRFGRKLWFSSLAFGPRWFGELGLVVTLDFSISLGCWAPCDTLGCSGLCCVVTVISFVVWFQTEAETSTSFHIPESTVPSRYVKPLLSQLL